MQNKERISVLENQVQTLKRIVYGFASLLVATIVIGATSMQSVPDVIKAKKFEVVNDDGKPAVVLDSLNEQYNNGGRVRVFSTTAGTGWDDSVAQIECCGRDAGFSFWYDGEMLALLGQDEGSGVVGVTSFWESEGTPLDKPVGKRLRTAAALMASMDGDFQPKVFLIDDAGAPLMFPPSEEFLSINTWKLDSRGRESGGQW